MHFLRSGKSGLCISIVKQAVGQSHFNHVELVCNGEHSFPLVRTKSFFELIFVI